MKLNLSSLLSILIACICVVLILERSNINRERKVLTKSLIDSKQIIDRFKTRNGDLVAEVNSLQLTRAEIKNYLKTIDGLKAEVRKWKQVNSALRQSIEVRVDPVEVVLDSIPCEFNRPFIKKDPWYLISGRVSNQSITFNEILIRDTMTIMIGLKRTGFLKSERTTNVIHSNPNIVVSDIKSLEVEERPKRWWIPLGLGILTGAILVK